MELDEFLVRAKIATYASDGEANEKVLEDGAKELTFENNHFRYRDRYYGFNPFVGEEIVWQRGKIVWSMNYFGKVSSNNISEKEIYAVLKSALRQVKSNRPFRGPQNLKCENFEYTNESNGDINNFTGVEKIFYKGQEVYKLQYHGGAI